MASEAVPVPSPGETVNIASIDGMADRYLSQHDIARLLGVSRTQVNVWRSRYGDFPAPDIELGLGEPRPGVPGWRPERMDEIRAWLAEHPRLVSH